ncbi:hypothetical protein [Romboutsia sp.]|uniref:hypothetical protein n=1 Tax=Romboutsia sp. TaxID=1965302 RepID=UPI002C9FDC76|nr:hypothetical protein [Romboutsia sp.]HSQ88063.1 hypothetical protein [Romboutsia sp.]
MKKNNKIKNINEYKKEKKNKHKNKRRMKFKKRISIFLISISTLGFMIWNIGGYVIVSDLKYEIHYLKQELRKEEIRLGELKAKIDTSTTIQEIEKRAKEELNMDYPEKNQIRYIEVEK